MTPATIPATRPARFFYLAASALCILVFIGHSVAIVQSAHASPQDDVHAQILRSLETYPLQFPGRTRTFIEIHTGFSWHYGFSYLLLACAALILYPRARADRSLLRLVALVCTLSSLVSAAISYRYFFSFPTSASLTILALFGCAAMCTLGTSTSSSSSTSP